MLYNARTWVRFTAQVQQWDRRSWIYHTNKSKHINISQLICALSPPKKAIFARAWDSIGVDWMGAGRGERRASESVRACVRVRAFVHACVFGCVRMCVCVCLLHVSHVLLVSHGVVLCRGMLGVCS